VWGEGINFDFEILGNVGSNVVRNVVGEEEGVRRGGRDEDFFFFTLNLCWFIEIVLMSCGTTEFVQ